MLIRCCPWTAQEYTFHVRSEEEWFKLSGVLVICRERGGGGGRREKAERGQRVRFLVFIPGPETFWSPISPPKRSRKSHVQQPERSIIKYFIDKRLHLYEKQRAVPKEIGPKLRLLFH